MPAATENVPSRLEELSELESLRAELESYRHWAAVVADVCEAAADGDLEERVLGCREGGDVGRLCAGVNQMLDMTDAFVRESRAALGAAGEGKFYRTVILRGMRGTFKIASRMINQAGEEMKEQADALAAADRRRLSLADDLEEHVQGVSERVSASAAELRITAESLS